MNEPVRILVADDLETQRMAIEVALAELGENVIAVDSGREALKYLLDNDAAVVLLDVNMPGMDGFETAELIRRRPRNASTPIIFLTADTDEMQAMKGYALGAVDYLICPFHPEVLRTKVKVFAELSRNRDRIRADAEQRIALSVEQAARAAAEEQSRRLRFLAETSGLLMRSLDDQSFAKELLEKFLPITGDLAALILSEPSGTHDPTPWVLQEGAGVVSRGTVPDAPLAEALQRCLASPEPVVLADPAGTPRPRGIAFPLVVRGVGYGALGVAMTGSNRTYGPDLLEILRLVAARTAIALDNQRLYLELQERDRRKDEFLAMLSHELRNPLGAIVTAARLLEMVGSAEEPAARAREVIARQSGHLARMVDDLLEVSRVTTGQIVLVPGPVNLRHVTERSIEALRASGRLDQHTLRTELDDAWVEGDDARIDQVMTNLLVNALKYTDAGGDILVKVERQGPHAVIRVRDSGIGISADLLPRVFEAFVQGRQALDRAEGGLGLGLSLVRKLVEMHGGSVEAQSEGTGFGSTFLVRLPWLASGEVLPAVESGAPSSDVHLRLLLVEDDPDVRAMTKSLLALRGHEIHEASTGPEAVEVARRVHPHLALVDLGLPGFDGFEVARCLREDGNGRRMVIAALTGYGQPRDRRRTMEAGFDAHLVKPVSSEHLARVLELAARRSSEPVEA